MLPPIARARAGDWPRERTVVIGDTPRDIACARADGLRVIAVATGPFPVEALADADAVALGGVDRSGPRGLGYRGTLRIVEVVAAPAHLRIRVT